MSKLHYLHFSAADITGAISLDIFENFISLKQEEQAAEIYQDDVQPPFSFFVRTVPNEYLQLLKSQNLTSPNSVSRFNIKSAIIYLFIDT
jgi:hypothetical protein